MNESDRKILTNQLGECWHIQQDDSILCLILVFVFPDYCFPVLKFPFPCTHISGNLKNIGKNFVLRSVV